MRLLHLKLSPLCVKSGCLKKKTNVNGGAIALGHPLGATGAILTARLLAEMKNAQMCAMVW